MFALILLLLAAPARALDPDVPGEPARHARAIVEVLPVEARVELHKMFRKYREEISKRTDQGWSYGALDDAVVEDVDEPFQSVRLLEEALVNRQQEVAAAEAAIAKAGDRSGDEDDAARAKLTEKKRALARVQRRLRREKGICRDWSDDLWFLFTQMNLDHWTVEDKVRTARPFHTGAVACAPQDDPQVCLVFDPWVRGKPDVYAFAAWDANAVGGRIPADYFLHQLPEKVP